MYPKKIYYEPKALDYELGQRLKEKYSDVEWIPIESHNNIEELRNKSNSDFVEMKKYLIIGIRKTHKYVENQKVSDYLAAALCVCTVILFATIINAHICECM